MQPSSLDHRSPEEIEADRIRRQRQALEQDRARFTQLKPQGEQLLGVFRRGNLPVAVQAFEDALRRGSGMVLQATIDTWKVQADHFATFGLQVVAAPPPRLHRQAELDAATAALTKAQAELATFEAEPYALADVDNRIVPGLTLRERIRHLEILVTRLQGAASQ